MGIYIGLRWRQEVWPLDQPAHPTHHLLMWECRYWPTLLITWWYENAGIGLPYSSPGDVRIQINTTLHLVIWECRYRPTILITCWCENTGICRPNLLLTCWCENAGTLVQAHPTHHLVIWEYRYMQAQPTPHLLIWECRYTGTGPPYSSPADVRMQVLAHPTLHLLRWECRYRGHIYQQAKCKIWSYYVHLPNNPMHMLNKLIW